jgi:hypothetical protein
VGLGLAVDLPYFGLFAVCVLVLGCGFKPVWLGGAKFFYPNYVVLGWLGGYVKDIQFFIEGSRENTV